MTIRKAIIHSDFRVAAAVIFRCLTSGSDLEIFHLLALAYLCPCAFPHKQALHLPTFCGQIMVLPPPYPGRPGHNLHRQTLNPRVHIVKRTSTSS
jgi:hypothetical protein